MPQVSLIIPAYNAAPYLPRCIASLLGQTFSDCEFIFVNDGSKDKTHEIIAEAAIADPRVKLIDKANGGVSSARNAGLDAASAPYIAFVDADDHVESRYVEVLLDLIRQTGAGLSVCGLDNSEERKLERGVITLSSDDQPRVVALFRSYLIHNVYCKVYHKSIIEKNHLRFDPDFDYGEDFLFNLGYIEHIATVATTPDILYYYDLSVPDSLSKKFNMKRFAGVEVQNAATERYFKKLGLSSPLAESYLQGLDYWNAYEAVHDMLEKITVTPKANVLADIRSILNFRYFARNARTPQKRAWLMRLFALRRPEIIYFLARQYRKHRG